MNNIFIETSVGGTTRDILNVKVNTNFARRTGIMS